MNKKYIFSAFFALAMFLSASFAAQTSAQIVINEVYGGGGNSGAAFNQDFVELYNAGTADVDLTGYSIQYTSATGVGNYNTCALTGADLVVEPGTYFLIGAAFGANTALPALPTVDADCSANTPAIAISGTAGKVALVSNITPLNGANGCPTAGAVDFVGYGATANCFEGAGPAGGTTNPTSVQRIPNGTDTNNNAADFQVNAPTPKAMNVAPTAAGATVEGRVLTNRGKAIANAKLTLTDSQGNARSVTSGRNGTFRFTEVEVGQTYILNISSRGYRFNEPTRVLTVNEDLDGINFVAY